MSIKKLLHKKGRDSCKYNPDSKNWSKTIKLSKIGHPCLRRLFYEYHRTEPDYGISLKNYWKGRRGSGVDSMLKDCVSKLGLSVKYQDSRGNVEIPVSDPDLWIKNNRVDDVVVAKDIPGLGDGLWILEYKSIGNKAWKYLKREPNEEHLWQGMGYVFLLENGIKENKYNIKEFAENKEVKGVVFIYVNREDETKDFKEFIIKKDPILFEKILKKIAKLQNYVKIDKLPPKTAHFCNWCSYRDKCQKEEK